MIISFYSFFDHQIMRAGMDMERYFEIVRTDYSSQAFAGNLAL